MNRYLSIIIPAFNEEKRLPETLALVRDWVERQKFSVEVLVVDDGSTDGTVAVVEEIMQRFPELRVITNQANKGKGGVVAQGMLAAHGEWRLFMDADASTPIAEVHKLLNHTGAFEVIIGSRYLHPDSIKVKQPFKRRVVSRLWNVVIQTSLLPGIRDTQCGFKLFSAAAAQAIFAKQKVDGWLFDVEILTIARHLSYAIKEVPVDWYDSRDSKLRAMKAGMRALKDLTGIKKRLKGGSY
jgi:glycosyltransferase involved in cell wall biosynthesis